MWLYNDSWWRLFMNTRTCEEAKKVGGAQKLLQFLEKLRPMFETLALRRGTEPPTCLAHQFGKCHIAKIHFLQYVDLIRSSVPLHHVAEEMGAEGYGCFTFTCWISLDVDQHQRCSGCYVWFRGSSNSLEPAWTGHQPGRQGLKGTKLLEVGRW